MSLTDLAQPHVAKLHAYTPGLQPTEPGWVKLNTNECPYPPSPRVAEAVRREVGEDGAALRLYPNPASAPLRAAAGYTVPSYSLYPVLVGMQDGASEIVPFDRSMRLPVERIAASRSRIFFLTSPNAPTGVAFANAELERILAAFPGILVVDEAYAPFADEDAVPLLARHPRLVITRTLSKAYALAGIRVGYALADPEVIGLLDRLRDSYNVNRLSQAAALAAIGDVDHLRANVGRVKATRDRCLAEFAARGWFTYPSKANFIFTEPRDTRGVAGPEVARAAYDFLCARKVLVRHFPSHALTASFLRITVGTDPEMRVLSESLDAWQSNRSA